MTLNIVHIVNLAPPFRLTDLSYVPPPLATEDFLTALRNFLLDVPGLAGLTGVFHWRAGSAPTGRYPFLFFKRLHQTTIFITTKHFYRVAVFQFDVLAQDEEEADTLGQAAYDALTQGAGAETILFAGGYEMGRSPQQFHGPDEEPGLRPGGVQVWRCRFDCEFQIGLRS